MKGFDAATVAIFMAVANQVPAELLAGLVEASKVAADAGNKLKADRETQKATKGTLFEAVQKVARFTVEHTDKESGERDWNRNHFEIILGLAIEKGANENSMNNYKSLFGKYIEGTSREENPLPTSMLYKDSVTVAQMRDAITDEETKERKDTLASIRESLGFLNNAELAKVEADLFAQTKERREKAAREKIEREAKKAQRSGKKAGAVVDVAVDAVAGDAPAEEGVERVQAAA